MKTRPNRVKVYFLSLLALVGAHGFALSAAAETGRLRTTIDGQLQRLPKLAVGESARISIVIAGGRHELKVRRARGYTPRVSNPRDITPVLFKGREVSHSNSLQRLGVAGHIINGELELVFFNRRGRLITVTYSLASRSRARVAYVSRYYELGCGTIGQAGTAGSGSGSGVTYSIGAAVYNPVRYLEISTDADAQFYALYKSTTNARIQSILNASEAIYLNEIGLGYDLLSQHIFADKNLPSRTTISDSLLDEFKSYSNKHHQLASSDAYHLFTGKSMRDSVIGISFVGKICQDSGTNSYGITQHVGNSIQVITFTHEMGHNLGADHDDLTPSIMSSVVTPSNTNFSAFSIGQITSYIDTFGACLTTTRIPRIRLSLLSYSAPGRLGVGTFRAALLSSGTDLECTLELYGSTRRSDLSSSVDPAAGNASRLLRRAISPRVTTSVTARLKNGSGNVRAVYLQARMSCPDSSVALSAVKQVSVNGYKPSGTADNALKQLKSTLKG